MIKLKKLLFNKENKSSTLLGLERLGLLDKSDENSVGQKLEFNCKTNHISCSKKILIISKCLFLIQILRKKILFNEKIYR